MTAEDRVVLKCASRLAEAPVADQIVRQIQELETLRQPSHRVILFNDDHHTMDEVVLQIQKATGYSLEKAEAIMWEAHTRGQAVVYCGALEECNRVASILEDIGLRVAVEPV